MTGGYAGLGFELSQILYAYNAIVYIAGRSQLKASTAIARIKDSTSKSAGRLEFMEFDLSDLSTIKHGVETFLAKEQRLHVLVNNAGVCRFAYDRPYENMSIFADTRFVHRSCFRLKVAQIPMVMNSKSERIALDHI